MKLATAVGQLPGRASKTRDRLLVLAVLAAIPITILAGGIAWQGFEASQRSALDATNVLGGIAENQFVRSSGLMQDILQRAASTPGSCTDQLGQLVQRSNSILAAVTFDALGNVQCRVDSRVDIGDAASAAKLLGSPVPGWFEQARGGARFAIGQASVGNDSIFAIPIADGGVLAAVLPPGWRADTLLPETNDAGSALWLLDRTGATVASRGPLATARPNAETLAALDGDEPLTLAGSSASGQPFGYIAIPLSDGMRLLVARPTARERKQGLDLLMLRISELTVLMVAGVAAIVLGVDFAFGRPVRRLRAAVERWRAGGAFEPETLLGAPDEVLELAQTFRDATDSLRRQEAELTKAKEMQELLVLEIHHRVKNNLQVVASLLNLQASRIRVPEARAEFQAARDRVRALATLHRHLYSEGELLSINMRSFLVELCGQLFQAMGETPGDRIDLVIEAPELRISSDQAVPLALIVTEAVTNSVKYAFPGGRRGHVSIRLLDHDGQLDLLISDDGIGIPAGRVETESGTRDGIGRQLIRGFTRQLGATLAVEEGEGTRYAVRLAMRPPTPVATPAALDPAIA